MIKNEREYRITKAQRDKFARAFSDLNQSSNTTGNHPLLIQLQRDSLQSQIDELSAQIAEYDALKSGIETVIEFNSFDELPKSLIKARIANGLSQKDLAEKLGLKEQQIQRYEATNYESASLARLKEVIRALNIYIQEDIFLPKAEVTTHRLLDRLIEAGLDRNLVVKRLFPPELVSRLQADFQIQEGMDNLALKTANIIGKVFGWTPSAIFSSSPLTLRTDLAGQTRYRVRSRVEEKYLNLYTTYAFSLCILSLKATTHLPKRVVPTDSTEVRNTIIETYGNISFESVLKYVWDLGIPVLPLNDESAFSGACWRIQGRNIIVLKQKDASMDQELFYLLHELGHAGQEPDRDEFAVMETGNSLSDRWNSEEEVNASQYAVDVLLNRQAEELVAKSISLAKGKMERLKFAVQQVASHENISTGVLANYMAYRLSLQNQNWWGAASNLQEHDQQPIDFARRLFLQKTNLNVLSGQESALLHQALSDLT